MRRWRRRWWCACLAGLWGCVTAYDPARLELSGLPRDADQRVVKVLSDNGYHLAHVLRDPLRVRTRWSHHQRGDVPGWKRAAVYVDEYLDAPATLNVVVEVRYLNIGLFGWPYETAVYADRELEQVLIDALRDAFQ